MQNYKIETTNKFEKDAVKCIKRGLDIEILQKFILLLEQNQTLPEKYKTHLLKGNFIGHYECHLKPDWLLIWIKDEANKTIKLVRTGTHSDLF